MPTTGPAHLSLFTGLYPSEIGATRNGEALTDRHAARELAAVLAAQGYAAGAFVTSRLAGPDATGLRGFDVYDPPLRVLRAGADAVDPDRAKSHVDSVCMPAMRVDKLSGPHA